MKRNVETSGSRHTHTHRTCCTELKFIFGIITSTELKNVLFLHRFLTIIIHKTTNCKALYGFCTFHSFPFTVALQATLWEKQMESYRSSFCEHDDPLTQVMVMFGAVWVQISTRIWHGKVQLLTIKPIHYRLDRGNLSVWF